MKFSARLALSLVALVGVSQALAAEPASGTRERFRTRIVVVGLDGSSQQVVLDAPGRFGAPDWSPDGESLMVNSEGKLWRVPVGGGSPTPVALGKTGLIDVNHGISPDGKTLAFTSAAALFRQTLDGRQGAPVRVIPATPSYFHAWSPDGKLIAYSANLGSGFDIFMIASDGGAERRLTTNPKGDDAPQFSPDGKFLYFLSDRSGNREIWRMPASGAGQDDRLAEQITKEDRIEAAPHPAPDGQWLVYLSHPPRTPANVLDRDVLIRRLPLKGNAPGKPEQIARLVGGHGTLGSRPFSPDGRKLAYAAYELPPPTIRIVLYTPSDMRPPAGVPHRLTQIAEATERFLFEEMRRWKYSPAVDHLFRRSADGTVEVVYVQGNRPVSDPFYTRASCRSEAVQKAKEQLHIDAGGHLWWVFLYVGDRPRRFSGWEGGGCSRDGGSAIVNYDTVPGEIRPDLNPAEGFNAEYFLKGTIHELGHAFGLPHIGPDPSLELGNSLMGPNNDVYAKRKYPHADRTYLTEASAAMLWKHPIFSGTAKDRQSQPSVQLVDYKPQYSRKSNKITLAGRLVADMPAHSVVVLDDLGKPDDEYWNRSHVARIDADGKFQVEIDRPARASGHFRILFCLENGMVTGDGAGVIYGDYGAIRKSYRFRDGGYLFGD